jgi:hypothetical protein
MSERPFWGNILKSNSNGTYYGLSMEYANRDGRGLVDFEKMIGLDGIALINIVANPDEAKVTNEKKLQSRITHNDGKFGLLVRYLHELILAVGGTWSPLEPPTHDSFGQRYECDTAVRSRLIFDLLR